MTTMEKADNTMMKKEEGGDVVDRDGPGGRGREGIGETEEGDKRGFTRSRASVMKLGGSCQ